LLVKRCRRGLVSGGALEDAQDFPVSIADRHRPTAPLRNFPGQLASLLGVVEIDSDLPVLEVNAGRRDSYGFTGHDVAGGPVSIRYFGACSPGERSHSLM
jgi:hypothetical protein